MRTGQISLSQFSTTNTINKTDRSNINVALQKRHTASGDQFIRFTSSTPLRNDPAFTQNRLAPALATVEDLPQAARLLFEFVKENQTSSIEHMCLALSRLTEEQQRSYFSNIPGGEGIIKLWPQLGPILQDPERLKSLFAQLLQKGLPEPDTFATLLKQRYIDNPQGALLILKDPNGQIVGIEGINQFQNTHDFQIDQGIYETLDPKHALVSALYVNPAYRNKGVGTALKKTVITYAREALGYQYVWAPTERENSSHRTNQKLGYTPLTSETHFPDSPAFTPEKIQALLTEYNIGSHELCWRRTATI